MSHECAICYNDFSWDPTSKNKSRLPVQSRVCSHVLCYSCVISIHEAQAEALYGSQMLACPECRLKGAHDPVVPIISRSVCELLSERNRMVRHDPTLEPVEEEIKRQSVVKRQSQQIHKELPSASSLLADALQEQASRIRKDVTENFSPWRLTREASRACYWGSILVFGAIDRNKTATVPQETVEKVWDMVSEKLEEPMEIPVLINPGDLAV